MVAHPLEARQMFKLHRLFTMSNQLVNFFDFFPISKYIYHIMELVVTAVCFTVLVLESYTQT